MGRDHPRHTPRDGVLDEPARVASDDADGPTTLAPMNRVDIRGLWFAGKPLAAKGSGPASATSLVSEPHSDQLHVTVDFHQTETVVRERLAERIVELVLRAHAQPQATTELGVLGEVRIVQMCLPDIPVTGPLLFADLAQLIVVEQQLPRS